MQTLYLVQVIPLLINHTKQVRRTYLIHIEEQVQKIPLTLNALMSSVIW